MENGKNDMVNDNAKCRTRARGLGIAPGTMHPGPSNAITDVSSVKVGHFTLHEGSRIRTGATAILPHGGNIYQNKVPAAVAVGNGFGKLAGSTQIEELGEIETPIILTNTLSVSEGIAAVVEWTLRQPGNEEVVTINSVVGETNDGYYINDIRARSLKSGMILESIESASEAPPEEGNVGAGTGTVAFDFKGGIGTSSRKLDPESGGYCIGVLVQSNFDGNLRIDGIPFGCGTASMPKESGGSIMIVVATDAPLSDRNLKRLAHRALSGLARVGANMSNGSGDYVIAFSTAKSVRRTPLSRSKVTAYEDVPNDSMDPIFLAAIESTEEAILNSLLMANDTRYEDSEGTNRTVEAISLDKIRTAVASGKKNTT